MKKYLLITVLTIPIFSTKAQNSFPSSSHLSERMHFNAGLTLSKFSGNNQSNASFLYGFAFGAIIKILVPIHRYIVPGAGFEK